MSHLGHSLAAVSGPVSTAARPAAVPLKPSHQGPSMDARWVTRAGEVCTDSLPWAGRGDSSAPVSHPSRTDARAKAVLAAKLARCTTASDPRIGTREAETRDERSALASALDGTRNQKGERLLSLTCREEKR